MKRKAMYLCRALMCRRTVHEDGRSERDEAKRYCQRHEPGRVAAAKAWLAEGRERRARMLAAARLLGQMRGQAPGVST